MRISVILSTYDQPAWLAKVLEGYATQDDRAFELLVADDGSGPETARVVRAFRDRTGVDLRHVWHEARDYERSTVLNQAVVRSRGDYLVFSDGDCIPRRDFVATHRALARPGHFLSGGMVKLPVDVSRSVTAEDIRTGRCFGIRWLRARGVRLGRHVLRLLGPGPWSLALDAVTPTKSTFNLNNASTWKNHVLEANGFEREMRQGGADRAFGERLENLGVRGLQVRFRAVLLHLEHDRPYATRESRARNEAIRDRIRMRGEVRARDGIDQLDLEAAWERKAEGPSVAPAPVAVERGTRRHGGAA